MGKLTGTLVYSKAVAQHLLEDIEKEEMRLVKKGVSKDEISRMPARIKAPTKTKNGRLVELHLGLATDRSIKVSKQDRVDKTAEEQIHTRILVRDVKVISEELIGEKLSIDMSSQPLDPGIVLQESDVESGRFLKTEGGQKYKVVSCGEMKKTIVEHLEQFEKVEATRFISGTEHRNPEQLAKDMHYFRKAGADGINPLMTACRMLTPQDHKTIVNMLIDNKKPEDLYAFRRMLAQGMQFCDIENASDVLQNVCLYQEAGTEGVMRLQYHMASLPYDEALSVFNELKDDVFLGQAVRSAMVSHIVKNQDDMVPTSFSGWVIQCDACIDACRKSTNPQLPEDTNELSAMVQSSDAMMEKFEQMLETKPGPSFVEIASLSMPALNKLYKRICVENSQHPMAKDIANACKKTLSEYGLEQEDKKANLVVRPYENGGISEVCGADSIETPDVARAFKNLPNSTRAGNNDLNLDSEFKEIASPAFSNIPTPALCAVKNAEGKPVYPGNTVATHHGNYLALQGPTGKNVGQFWDVLLSNDVHVSVSLTKEGEINDPFPAEGESKQYGTHTVENLKTRELIAGRLEVHHLLVDGKPHVRVCMRNWTDMTGSNAAILAATAMVAQSFNEGMETMAVNCVAGVGRTCTYIGVSEAVMSAANGEPPQTVNEMVELMRIQRGNNGVQRPAQLKTILVGHQYAKELAAAFLPVISVH